MNFKDNQKLLLLVAIVVMAYVLSIEQGLKNTCKKEKAYKGQSNTLAVSIFRQGLSLLKARAWTLIRFLNLLQNVFLDLHKPQWVNVQ